MFLLVCVAVVLPMRASATLIYSLNFLGEPLESGDVRSIALGGSTQLLADTLGVLQLNPALLAALPMVTIGTSQFVGIDQARSDLYEERDVSFTFPSIKLAVPIRGWFTLMIGYRGRYDPDGSFAIGATTPSGQDYTTTYERSGGLYSVPLTVAMPLGRFVAIGLTASLERGDIENRWNTVFTNAVLGPAVGIQQQVVSGWGAGAGLAVRPWSRLIIGGMWESQINYDSKIKEVYTNTALDTSYTATMKLPPFFSAGVTLGITRSILIAGSFGWRDMSQWEGFWFDASRLEAEKSYAVGIEFGNGIPTGRSWLPVRLGFNYQTLPYDHPKGSGVINKYLASLGTSLRLGGGKGKVDITFQGGKEASLADNGIEDRVFRVYFGVAGAEEWRRRGGGRF